MTATKIITAAEVKVGDRVITKGSYFVVEKIGRQGKIVTITGGRSALRKRPATKIEVEAC